MLRPPAAQLAVILFRARAANGTAALVALVAANGKGILVVRRTQIGANARWRWQLGAHLLAAQIAELIVRRIAQTQVVLVALIVVVQVLLVDGAVAVAVAIVQLVAAGRVLLGLDGGQRRKLLPIAVHLARAAGGHLEDVHMQPAHLVPAQQPMVVVDLRAVRAIRLRQIRAAFARIAAKQRKPIN